MKTSLLEYRQKLTLLVALHLRGHLCIRPARGLQVPWAQGRRPGAALCACCAAGAGWDPSSVTVRPSSRLLGPAVRAAEQLVL